MPKAAKFGGEIHRLDEMDRVHADGPARPSTLAFESSMKTQSPALSP